MMMITAVQAPARIVGGRLRAVAITHTAHAVRVPVPRCLPVAHMHVRGRRVVGRVLHRQLSSELKRKTSRLGRFWAAVSPRTRPELEFTQYPKRRGGAATLTVVVAANVGVFVAW